MQPTTPLPNSSFSIPHSPFSSPPAPFPLYPGELNLIVGRPGIGKSLLALDLAARAVHGTLPPFFLPDNPPDYTDNDDFPDGRPKAYSPGTAAILSVEHHSLPLHVYAFGMEPEFAKMPPRADLSMDPFHNDEYEKHARRFHNDSQFLQFLRDRKNTRVVILDPLPAFLGPINATSIAILEQLQPVLDYATEKGIFLIGISHLVKTPRRHEPVHHVIGSLGYSAMARSVLLLTHDQHPAPDADPLNRRLLVPVKNNHAPIDAAYAFTFRPRPPLVAPVEPPPKPKLIPHPDEEFFHLCRESDRAHDAYRFKMQLFDHQKKSGEPLPPILDWDPQPLLDHPQLPHLFTNTPDPADGPDPIQHTLFLRAQILLANLLRNGPIRSSLAFKVGRDEGISHRTMERARQKMDIACTFIPTPEPPGGYFQIALPRQKITSQPPA